MAQVTSELAQSTELAPDFVESFYGGAIETDSESRPAAYFFSQLDENPRLNWLCRYPLGSRLRRVTRERGIRLLDIVFSLAALIVVAPVLLLIAVRIPLESPGSPFFIQVRAGRGNSTFRMFKLRSMRSDSNRGGVRLATSDDLRVTRIGKFIRRMRIDELPQFLNVLRGEMSIVGPRPEIPAIANLNQKRIPDYYDRHDIRPGITGLAQILNGYDIDVDEVRRTVALDKYWVLHHGIRNYLLTLFRTIPVVLFGRGAL